MPERHDDDNLLQELAGVLNATDPVPSHVLEAARGSFAWRTVDAELAELVFDSAEAEPTGVRSQGAGERQVTFRSPALEVEMAMVGGDRRQLVGQLVPPQQAELQLVSGEVTLETQADDVGRFSFDDVPAGPASIRCLLADGTRIQTDWLLL